MSTHVAIYGASGLGALVLDTLRQQQRQVAGFLDSDGRRHGTEVDGVAVLGGIATARLLIQKGTRDFFVAVGDCADRLRLAGALRAAGARLIQVVHPLASIAPSAVIGEHVFVGARAMICVHARIAQDTIIGSSAIVEHDNLVGRGVLLHPGVRLAGGVRVDDRAVVEIGAAVIPGRRVGRAARVRAGSVVIRDVPPGAVVEGVPARVVGRSADVAGSLRKARGEPIAPGERDTAQAGRDAGTR